MAGRRPSSESGVATGTATSRRASPGRPRTLVVAMSMLSVLAAVPHCAAVPVDGVATLCIMTDLAGHTSLEGLHEVNYAIAGLAAVENWNARSCRIVSYPTCNLTYGSRPALHIDPIVVNYGAFPGGMAAISAVFECQRRGADFMYVATSPDTTNMQHVLTVTAALGVFAASSTVTSAGLSNNAEFPRAIRTSPSDLAPSRSVLGILEGFSWTRALIIHSDNTFGIDMARKMVQVLEGGRNMEELVVTVPFTEEDVDSAMRVAVQGQHKLFLLESDYANLDELLFSADEAGLFADGYVWLMAGFINLDEIMEASRDSDRLGKILSGFLRVGNEPLWDREAVAASVATVGVHGLRQKIVTDWDIGPRSPVLPREAAHFSNVRLETAYAFDAVYAAILALDYVDAHHSQGGRPVPAAPAPAPERRLARRLAATKEEFLAGHPSVTHAQEVFDVLASGVLTFNGASGAVEFDANGDRNEETIRWGVFSIDFIAAAHAIVESTVAHWTYQDGFYLEEGIRFAWPGGVSYYPDVIPNVSRPKPPTDMTLYYVVGAMAATLLAIAALATWLRHEQAMRANPLYGVKVQEILDRVYSEVAANADGDVATYIPELAKVDPDKFGICVVTTTGKVYKVGDADEEFTIQSASKPFMYAFLMCLQGEEFARQKIDAEPSGEAFNSAKLGPDGRPFNPLINQGAIACMALASTTHPDADPQGLNRYAGLKGLMSASAGRELSMHEATYESERETGDQNRVIAQALLDANCIENETDREAGLNAYLMGCSTLTTCVDLAVMGATLANKGKNPKTRKQVVDGDIAQSVSSLMMTCGMYTGAGNWMRDVGLPAKSGVSGSLVAVVPGSCAIAVWSPRLNASGNSVRAMAVCKMLSKHLGLHILRKGDKRRKKKRASGTSTNGSEGGGSSWWDASSTGTASPPASVNGGSQHGGSAYGGDSFTASPARPRVSSSIPSRAGSSKKYSTTQSRGGEHDSDSVSSISPPGDEHSSGSVSSISSLSFHPRPPQPQGGPGLAGAPLLECAEGESPPAPTHELRSALRGASMDSANLVRQRTPSASPAHSDVPVPLPAPVSVLRKSNLSKVSPDPNAPRGAQSSAPASPMTPTGVYAPFAPGNSLQHIYTADPNGLRSMSDYGEDGIGRFETPGRADPRMARASTFNGGAAAANAAAATAAAAATVAGPAHPALMPVWSQDSPVSPPPPR